MKRQCLGRKLVLHRPLLMVGGQGAVLGGELLAEHLEASGQGVGRDLGIRVVNRHFIEPAPEKATLNRRCLALGQEALARLNLQNANIRLISGKRNRKVQGMFIRPNHQFLRRITPAQSEGRFHESLRSHLADAKQQDGGIPSQGVEGSSHTGTVADGDPRCKDRSHHRGFLLIEATVSLSILALIGLVMLKLSLNILHPRQWVLQQALTDAYMTYERAYAERVPFETLTSNTSPWPAHPTLTSSEVEIGRLPGGAVVTGTVSRTRLPDPNNYPLDGGSGTLLTNPASMKVWQVQSVLTYRVGPRTYAKSRTVIRSQ